MAGRGRGRASFTFNIEALGLGRGEALPDVAYQPRQVYPPTDYKPLPLKTGEDEDYMLALKHELKETMQSLPYHMDFPSVKKDVARYKEKYLQEYNKEMASTWTPDWRRLPRELMPIRKKKKISNVNTKPKIAPSKEKVDIVSKLEELEKKDEEGKSDGEGEEKKKPEEEEEEEEAAEEEYDEEEFEEENDYIASYFEDGDDFGGGSDDNVDEATY
ncbi:DNA-directed RNA polymerase III subunit RPC7-like [Huso huso]|uniref:DNA-directed RNA polymerase III subunit RPC7-like n=1 Tax=Huso huso TaxID=61971 RepID=A0ABR1A5Q6_HUSHU